MWPLRKIFFFLFLHIRSRFWDWFSRLELYSVYLSCLLFNMEEEHFERWGFGISVKSYVAILRASLCVGLVRYKSEEFLEPLKVKEIDDERVFDRPFSFYKYQIPVLPQKELFDVSVRDKSWENVEVSRYFEQFRQSNTFHVLISNRIPAIHPLLFRMMKKYLLELSRIGFVLIDIWTWLIWLSRWFMRF
jgi:hypothetical protein